MAAVKVVADVAVRARDSVLLVRYEDVSKYDGERGWFLPDDYLATSNIPKPPRIESCKNRLALTYRI